MKKLNKLFWTMSVISACFVSHAAIEEHFEGVEDWTWVGKPAFYNVAKSSWLGMAHVEDVTNKVTSVAGYPIDDSKDNPHMKTICALGSVTAENNIPKDPGKYAQVEYLQQVTVTVDTLVTDEMEDVQVALATGKKLADDPNFVDLWLYCLPKGETHTAWIKVGKARLGTYMRVNLAFDYENQSCRVSVNGIPRMSAGGYLLPECDPNGGDGSWYKIGTAAFNEVKEHVNNVQFIGLYVRWDDVKISEDKFEDHSPFPKTAEARVDLTAKDIDKAGGETPHWMNVSLNDLNRWAIDDDVDTKSICLDKSGHTVHQKLELGYDPLDGKKFAPTNMAIQVDEKGNERITLAIPKAKPDSDLIYRIVATGTHDNGKSFRQVMPAQKDSLENATTATGDLEPNPPRVLFFQLEAERIEKEP